jgi:hypothetical protein
VGLAGDGEEGVAARNRGEEVQGIVSPGWADRALGAAEGGSEGELGQGWAGCRGASLPAPPLPTSCARVIKDTLGSEVAAIRTFRCNLCKYG